MVYIVQGNNGSKRQDGAKDVIPELAYNSLSERLTASTEQRRTGYTKGKLVVFVVMSKVVSFLFCQICRKIGVMEPEDSSQR